MEWAQNATIVSLIGTLEVVRHAVMLTDTRYSDTGEICLLIIWTGFKVNADIICVVPKIKKWFGFELAMVCPALEFWNFDEFCHTSGIWCYVFPVLAALLLFVVGR